MKMRSGKTIKIRVLENKKRVREKKYFSIFREVNNGNNEITYIGGNNTYLK